MNFIVIHTITILNPQNGKMNFERDKLYDINEIFFSIENLREKNNYYSKHWKKLSKLTSKKEAIAVKFWRK